MLPALFPSASLPIPRSTNRELLRSSNYELGHRALIQFLRSLSILLRAGVDRLRAIETLIEQTPTGRMRTALCAMQTDMRANPRRATPLADAMAPHSRAFPTLVVAAVGAAEKHEYDHPDGTLIDKLDDLAAALERNAQLNRLLSRAFSGPLVVCAFVLAFFACVVDVVGPALTHMLMITRVYIGDVPLTIRLMIQAFHFLNYYLPILMTLAVPLLLVAATPSVRVGLDRAQFKLPIVGPAIRKTTTTRITVIFAALLKCDVDLVSAISLLRTITASPTYSLALHKMQFAVIEGASLSSALAATNLFDPVTLAVANSEQWNDERLQKLLSLRATYAQREIQADISFLTDALQFTGLILLTLALLWASSAIISLAPTLGAPGIS